MQLLMISTNEVIMGCLLPLVLTISFSSYLVSSKTTGGQVMWRNPMMS